MKTFCDLGDETVTFYAKFTASLETNMQQLPMSTRRICYR